MTFLDGLMRQIPTFLRYPAGGASMDEEVERRADEKNGGGRR